MFSYYSSVSLYVQSLKIKYRMKKYIILVAIIISCAQLQAQISEGGSPPSFNFKIQKSSGYAGLTLSPIKNIENLLEEDERNPIPFRYSIVDNVHINIKDKGDYLEDESGNKIWQYRINSREAYSLGLIFEKYRLPEGAKLFVYTPDKMTILGAFTSRNNKKSGKLQIQELQGKEAIIEYFEPKDAKFDGELVLGGVGQAYKNLFEDLPDTAYIGINCPIGDEWQLEKHAVVKYTSQQGSSIISCTGFLVNNTNEDGSPYMLTANHCIHTDSDAENLIAYFNYENEDCQNISRITSQTISEATMLATNSNYDFSLVKLSEAPPASYQPYYAGWSIDPDPTEQATSIHHPAGIEKSISIDYDSIETYSAKIDLQDGDRILSIPANSTWLVDFDRGRTVGGSSGSPLFDPNKRVIGLLSSGISSFELDFYIKLSRAYKPFNTSIDAQLEHWLDPAGLDPNFIDGYIPFPNTTPPDAHFSAEYRGICQGTELQLEDKSIFGASSWFWEFSPNTVTFVEGTETSQNPVVKFNDKGKYDLTLTVGNNAGNDSQTRNEYISTEDLNVKVRQISSSSLCPAEFEEVRVKATGADTYHWFIDDTITDFIELQGENTDSLIVTLDINSKPNFESNKLPDSLVTFKIYVEGTIDSCSTIEEFDINLLFHDNDDIANAFPLLIDSLQGPFRNSCATIEENEPIPPVNDCTTQGEWCGCELGNEYRFILSNSTWFTFIAPSSGIVGIETFGYDNQIAVYEAESAEDILSGELTRYEIIGANDDYSDSDFSAKIPSLAVTPGKKYWIQADGSACNTTGQFTIKISPEAIVDAEPNHFISNSVATIYPNPAKDFVTIDKKSNSRLLDVKLFDFNGKLVYEKQITDNSIKVDTKQFTRGFYIIQISDDNEIQTNKLIFE